MEWPALHIRSTAYLTVIIIVSGFLRVSAQDVSSIRGVVSDPENEPMPGVHVVIPELDIATFTDEIGEFRFDRISPGEYTLQFSMIGYSRTEQIVNVEPDSLVQISIELVPVILKADELVVTASRRSQLAGKVPVSISTVSTSELEARNVVTLDQALHHVPGVQVTGNQVNIRGSSGFAYGVGSRVLLLVDGIPLLGPDQGHIDFDGLPLNNIRQIEVLKSPGSALYGGGALGGVINLITEGYSDDPETNIRFYSGVYQPVRYREWRENPEHGDQFRPLAGTTVSHSRKVSDRFGYWVTGTLRTDTGYLENNSLKSAEGYAKAGWMFSRDMSIDLYTGFRRTRQEQFLYWNGLDDVLSPGSINFGGADASGSNRGLSDRLTFIPVFSHNVHPDFQYTVKARIFGAAFRPLDSRGNIRSRDQHTEGARYGLDVQFNSSPFEHVEIVGGGTFDANWVTSEFFTGEDSQTVRNQPEGSLFMQADTEWIPGFLLSAGFRYDTYRVHTRDVASQFSPKFGIAFEFSDMITLRGSFGRGFRVPSVAERFISNREFLPLESNLTLRPETSTGYEAGISARHLFGNGWGIQTDITGFRNNYRELVEPRFSPSDGAFRFINLTEAQIQGIETSVTMLSDDNRSNFRISYTFLDAVDTTTDLPLLFRSRHLFQSSAGLFLTGWLEAGADFRAISSPRQVDTDFSRFVDDADIFPDIYVTDLRIRFHPDLFDDIDVTGALHVNNLFDYYYVERPAFFAPPRSFQLVLQARF